MKFSRNFSKELSKLVRVNKFVAKEVVIQHRLWMDRWRSSKRTKKDSDTDTLESFFDMSVGASIPDLDVYQDLFEDEDEDEHP